MIFTIQANSKEKILVCAVFLHVIWILFGEEKHLTKQLGFI